MRFLNLTSKVRMSGWGSIPEPTKPYFLWVLVISPNMEFIGTYKKVGSCRLRYGSVALNGKPEDLNLPWGHLLPGHLAPLNLSYLEGL